ncbi:hypothetical protein DVH24_034153 [Malus domestica]|uniref:Uncharacterized protein n=1 Tax=Malus domestica TaxID=3750 RepID=A0A498I686_MALDO|nr:hypothetical protein DVH24_034153 [Malus domestica]
MDSKIVASGLADEIQTNPILRPIDVVRHFKKNYELAKTEVHGDDTKSYRQLLWYAKAVLATNPRLPCAT